MLVDAGNDIVGFFTTGVASNRTTVENAIGNQVSAEDKAVIMGVYDKLVTALSVLIPHNSLKEVAKLMPGYFFCI